MSKSIHYWRTQWESSCETDAAWKALDLLADYAHFFKIYPLICVERPWGGSIGRFFAGKWNTHHGHEVQSAISSFFQSDGECALAIQYQSVEYVLAAVKEKIGNNHIKPNGDLAKILQVIKEKTSIDYNAIDSLSIDERCRRAART